jgi:hypothetical protein
METDGNTSHDKKTAERETLRKRNKWSVWATHVKRLTKQAMEEVMEDSERTDLTNEDGAEDGNCSAALGKYWRDSYPELKPMDMVRADGMGGGVKMVISQQQNRVECDGNLTTTVEVVSMVDCTDMNHGADPGDSEFGTCMDFGDQALDQAWNGNGKEDLGICNTAKTSSIV